MDSRAAAAVPEGAGAPDECSRQNVERLRTKAVAKLETRCSGWAAFDCCTLATIHAPGDPETARRFAAGSCESGDPGGCDQLGMLCKQAGEIGRARALYARACRAGFARSCER